MDGSSYDAIYEQKRRTYGNVLQACGVADGCGAADQRVFSVWRPVPDLRNGDDRRRGHLKNPPQTPKIQ